MIVFNIKYAKIFISRKNIIFLLSMMILTYSPIELHSQEEWVKMNSPTTQTIWKLYSLDSLHSWAAGDSGLIIHTNNGGMDWQIQNSGVRENIQDIYFLNCNLGWAIATRFDSIFGSYILKTTSGGEIWEKEFFEIENKFFHTIYFIDSLSGFVAGGPSESFYRTTDGGRTWNSPQFDSTLFSESPVQSIAFFTKQYGFACGGLHDLVGVIWKTTDAGLSWSSKLLGPEPLREMQFIDSLNIIGVGGDFEYGTGVARTSDGGENWIYEEPGFLGVATGLSMRKNNEAWACLSSESKFIFSIDSGKTWEIFKTPLNSAIFDVVFTDSIHGLAVGAGGEILKYKPSPLSSLNQSVINNPTTNILFQNYPNPFNPFTTIQFQVSTPAQVSLKVYDVLGNEVAALENESREAGNYSVIFDANKFSSGIYFYTLRAGNFIDSKKMLLLR
jgi:photosystem II stability/assembly factor-like uncharacterized protein